MVSPWSHACSEGVCVKGTQGQAVHDQFLKLTAMGCFGCQKCFLKGMVVGAKSGSGWILNVSSVFSGPLVNRVGHPRHLVFRNHKIPIVTSARIVKLLQSFCYEVLLLCPSLFVL